METAFKFVRLSKLVDWSVPHNISEVGHPDFMVLSKNKKAINKNR